MKRIFVVVVVLVTTAFLTSGALAEKGGKAKDGTKCGMTDKAKVEKVEGEVLKVEKDTKTCPGCEMLIVTVKTEQGEEKVCLCLKDKNEVEVKVGDKLEVKVLDKTCMMGAKGKSMLCAKKAKCNGKSLKVRKCPMMGDGKMECPVMKEGKKDGKKAKPMRMEKAGETKEAPAVESAK